MKKLVIAIASAFALSTFAITASAQGHGGGGGGNWHGGGGNWHGGGDWHGGHGDFHGGHGGSHFGISFGFPFYYGPGYYPYGYYPYAYGYPYYPYYDGYSSYYDDGAPQVYIQRDTGDGVAPAGPPQRSQYSYYCTDPAGYYPQVANCPSGWLTVVPNRSVRPAPAPR